MTHCVCFINSIINNKSTALVTVVLATAGFSKPLAAASYHALATRPRRGGDTGGRTGYEEEGGHEDGEDTGAFMMGDIQEKVSKEEE